MDSQVAKLTSKGQLTLPKSVREKLNLDDGSYIAIYLEKDQLVMKKVNPKRPLSDPCPQENRPGGKPEKRTECRVTAIGEAAKWKPSL